MTTTTLPESGLKAGDLVHVRCTDQTGQPFEGTLPIRSVRVGLGPVEWAHFDRPRGDLSLPAKHATTMNTYAISLKPVFTMSTPDENGAVL